MMKRHGVALLALLTVACAGGQRKTQVAAANEVARISNELQPVVIEAYEDENRRCVRDAQSIDEGKACFAKVDARFLALFRARKALAIAQDRYATELERGGDGKEVSAGTLINTWCSFRSAAFVAGIKVPEIPVTCTVDASQ